MKSLLEKIKDIELDKIYDSLTRENKTISIEEQFKIIQEKFHNYDISFLWLLCYPYEHAPFAKKYIDKNYKKFHQYLDSGFPKKLAQKGGFNSHMWEMVLCDILSFSGELIPKSAAGSDFLLKLENGQVVQIEAVCPDEADDKSLRSIKPIYTKEEPIFSLGGNIDDLERPILLRALKGFDNKSKLNKYEINKPLIIAINSHNTVGLISNDDYILRRMLFGLGNQTITKKADDSFVNGLQYNPSLNKPGEKEFPIARFLDPSYSHISGVIYTSQSPLGLVPNGYGWHNSGVFYASNPNAKHKIDIDFPFFKKMICNTEIYEIKEASKNFEGLI
jgi:hypothetical protein